ncbi:hypothetical protein VTI28DRAFT_2255 [Corynascus sepedonium]
MKDFYSLIEPIPQYFSLALTKIALFVFQDNIPGSETARYSKRKRTNFLRVNPSNASFLYPLDSVYTPLPREVNKKPTITRGTHRRLVHHI